MNHRDCRRRVCCGGLAARDAWESTTKSVRLRTPVNKNGNRGLARKENAHVEVCHYLIPVGWPGCMRGRLCAQDAELSGLEQDRAMP